MTWRTDLLLELADKVQNSTSENPTLDSEVFDAINQSPIVSLEYMAFVIYNTTKNPPKYTKCLIPSCKLLKYEAPKWQITVIGRGCVLAVNKKIGTVLAVDAVTTELAVLAAVLRAMARSPLDW